MLAILVVMGTKYACNLDHVGDQICLQSRIFYSYNLEFLNSFLTQDDHFPGVLKNFEIAGIYGPQRDQDCAHIWSLLQPKLQA